MVVRLVRPLKLARRSWRSLDSSPGFSIDVRCPAWRLREFRSVNVDAALLLSFERIELAMGRDVTEAVAGSENNNRCHKRDLVLTVPLYPG